MEKEPNKKHATFRTLAAGGIVASALLTGCEEADKNNEKPQIIEEPSVATLVLDEESLKQISPTPTVEYVLPEELVEDLTVLPEFIEEEIYIEDIEEDSDVEEEIAEEFNYEMLDIRKWEDYKLNSVERHESGYTIRTTSPTSMFLIPLRNNEFFNNDEGSQVKEIKFSEGMGLEIAQTRTLKGPNGEKVVLGAVANSYGAKTVALVVLEAYDENGTKIQMYEQTPENSNTVLYINTESNIYPNKVYNTLRALRNISLYQEASGPLKSGEDYSYLTMIGLLNGNEISRYMSGLTASKSIVRAGGVCGIATGISSLMNSNGSKIIERWKHPAVSMYFQGPFSTNLHDIDATVQLGHDVNYDFRWEHIGGEKYIQIDIHLSHSGISYSETNADGIGGLSDVDFVISLSLTDEKPVGQAETLELLMTLYKSYRDSKHQNDEIFGDIIYTYDYYDVIDLHNVIPMLYDREELSSFSEIVEKDKTLKDLFSLKEAVNSYDENSGLSLAEYLRTTSWYSNYQKENPNTDLWSIVRRLDFTKVEGQPLQCVTYVALLPYLYPELRIQPIGGSGVKSAGDLVASEFKDLEGTRATGFGGLLTAGRYLTISDFQLGDVFVIRNGRHGHVGVVIGRVDYDDGEVVLLFTDSNKNEDGRISIREVHLNSIYDELGNGWWYFIRSGARGSISD